VATRIAGTIVHVYTSKKEMTKWHLCCNLSSIKEEERKKTTIRRERERERERLTVIAGESVVTFWTDAVKRVDAVDAGTAISARAISAVVNVYQRQNKRTRSITEWLVELFVYGRAVIFHWPVFFLSLFFLIFKGYTTHKTTFIWIKKRQRRRRRITRLTVGAKLSRIARIALARESRSIFWRDATTVDAMSGTLGRPTTARLCYFYKIQYTFIIKRTCGSFFWYISTRHSIK
jgi:hypothetical protein